MAVLDITVAESGHVHLIEANGSNAGLTSIHFGCDQQRAQHMALSFCSRQVPTSKCVALLPYKSGFLHMAEFHTRAAMFATALAADRDVDLCAVDEPLGSSAVTVVCGPVPAITAAISRRGRTLFYRNRPVQFTTNPTLIPELVRRGIISGTQSGVDIDSAIFHEGALVATILDKQAQQVATAGTGIVPLAFESANSLLEAEAVVRRFLQRHTAVVAKMNAGSGGVGIEFFAPGMSKDAIGRNLGRLVETAVATYGESVAQTMFPIRFFEFARSSGLHMKDGDHLWDMRFLCLVSPTCIDVYPTLIRICPAPFDGLTFDRDAVVSNLAGRPPSLLWARSPLDPQALREIGIKPPHIRSIGVSCAKWCSAAINRAIMDSPQ